MTGEDAAGSRPGRERLGRDLRAAGALSPDWAPTFAAVDRAAFLPDLVWPFDIAAQTSATVDRAEDPAGWHATADRDLPIVTQWDDGDHTGRGPGRVATSSSSMPSVVYRMLRELAPDEGMKVLDVGTGTGETAAALSHRCGAARVTTVEVDASVSRRAGARLRALGLAPRTVVGDGWEGYAAHAPYDRVLATVGLRAVPGAWLAQVRPGGLIVAPWGTHYTHADAVVRLTVHAGRASGRFSRPVEFMKLRGRRLPARDHGAYVPAGGLEGADVSSTEVPEGEFVPGRYAALPFVLGLRVRDCVQAVADRRDGVRPVWFYDLSDRSWACVLFREGEREARVWQSGARRLWEEVEAAYRWWTERGRPGHERFGLSVTPEGQSAWFDDSAEAWPV
ncbi:methyltransferase domain-containing protein [Streptomyces sp. DSM 44915]|uniref:Protein-L-isoaspartate O-methyltransferase n=1 Tax=Streptomyces chisholmiae TaxID=3075540 RepID=A0ABU2JN91_9ACTN|nr:methyltransferase domain-containing protein [Streptomyces sp. DSM 44915]MDT0265703.1 methyltransferase domain-containing protein [Streptomyces sp. DSM 44915]